MVSNAKIKDIQSLCHKKFRDKEKKFIIEGPKIIEEFLNHKPELLIEIYALPEWIEQHSFPKKMMNVIEVDEIFLKRVSFLSTPNQVIALVNYLNENENTIHNKNFIIALDAIQDPGNLGTIIRIANWFGVSQIVCGLGCADKYNPKLINASMGSILHVDIVYQNLHNFFEKNVKPVYAAVLDGEPIQQINKLTEGVLFIGNESKGIDRIFWKENFIPVTIPKKGKADSLNAAVATGILCNWLF